MIEPETSELPDEAPARPVEVNRLHAWLRLARRRRMVVPTVLVVVVVGVLAQGVWRAHRPLASSPAPRPAPAGPPVGAARLRPDLDKLPLAYISDYWQQLAGEARTCLVGLGIPGEAGVVIAPGLAVSGVRAGEAVERVGGEIAGHVRLLGLDARLGLSVLAVAPETETQPLVIADPTERWAGMAVAIVGLDSDWRPMVETTAIRKSDVVLERGVLPRIDVALPPGGATCAAVVDLDARLVGVVLPDPVSETRRVIPPEAAIEAAEDVRSGRPCRAIDVSALDPQLAEALRIDGGLLVDTVFAPAFSEAPGLEEGDVLLRWDGKRLEGVADLQAAYDATSPGASVSVLAWRGGRRHRVKLIMPDRACRPPERRPHEIPQIGVRVAWESGAGRLRAGYRVLAVEAGGAAEGAGLLPGDLIVAIDGRALTTPREAPWMATRPARKVAHVYRVFRGDRPLLAHVRQKP